MDFEELYNLYFKEVFLYIKSISGNESMAEEITQETFFKAIKSIDTFDGSKDIRAWLFAIAKNTYYSYYKKNKRQVDFDSIEDMTDVGVTISENLMNEEDALIIHKFIHTMSDPYKEVFSLRVFGELPFEKIGMIFGKSSGWARVTYHRAKKQIMEYMEGMNDERN